MVRKAASIDSQNGSMSSKENCCTGQAREPCHDPGTAQADGRRRNRERLKDGIDRQQLANNSNSDQPRHSNGEGVSADMRPKDRQRGTGQEERAQLEQVGAFQGTDVEFAEERCRTPGNPDEERAQNHAGAAPPAAKSDDQRKDGVEPQLVWQAPERLVDRRPHGIRESAGYELGHAPHEHQEIVRYIIGVQPEMGIVAVPEKGRGRGHNEHEGEIGKYAQEPRAHEPSPAARFLK